MTSVGDSRDAIAAVAAGTCADPFSVLGHHRTALGRRSAVVIRTMQPYATAVDLMIAGGASVRMTRCHSEGLFEATLPLEKPDGPAPEYRLRTTGVDGTVQTLDDPYAFSQVVGDYDLHLFSEGTHYRAWAKLGAHHLQHQAVDGVHFSVWAPNAQRVSVVGDFNRWDGRVHSMRKLVPSGVWEIFVPGLSDGVRYKFEVRTLAGQLLLKADPFARQCEPPPATASIVASSAPYKWRDGEWMDNRPSLEGWRERPMSIYEVHIGSWRRKPEEGMRPLTYRELAATLVPYVHGMGYTHLELMPVMEHPFFGSWGYQVTGFFAPTSRFGGPDDFRFLIDECHRHGLAVILDWVPGHFPKDAHGLARFDGTALYEHADPKKGEHREWGTLVFNYGRTEVSSFLLSNALYWLQEFHVDGLRVDAVTSMIYLDYSRPTGEWVPNDDGGREHTEAVEFLKQLNTITHERVPGSVTIAEESTAWPGVSRPVHLGGLGFTYKWNMGWMHDMLSYMGKDPVHRAWEHDRVTFSMFYAFTENFVLPFSHDEVVHGKGSLLGRMPGDLWQRHASLRVLYGFMFGHPGKKMLFMGGEVGQWNEWNHDSSIAWHLLDDPLHRGLHTWVRDLNAVYRRERALFEVDFDGAGFSWIDCDDRKNSVVSFVRRSRAGADLVVMVANFTPVPQPGYRVGVPTGGWHRELLNSDAACYGGSGIGNDGWVEAEAVPAHGHGQSLVLTLPPLGFLMLKPEPARPPVV